VQETHQLQWLPVSPENSKAMMYHMLHPSCPYTNDSSSLSAWPAVG